MKVVVVPHNPAWRNTFEAEAKLIAAALGENVEAIHHIGSTAIPNIYAKPVIDFLVEVRDIIEVDEQSSAMEYAVRCFNQTNMCYRDSSYSSGLQGFCLAKTIDARCPQL